MSEATLRVFDVRIPHMGLSGVSSEGWRLASLKFYLSQSVFVLFVFKRLPLILSRTTALRDVLSRSLILRPCVGVWGLHARLSTMVVA